RRLSPVVVAEIDGVPRGVENEDGVPGVVPHGRTGVAPVERVGGVLTASSVETNRGIGPESEAVREAIAVACRLVFDGPTGQVHRSGAPIHDLDPLVVEVVVVVSGRVRMDVPYTDGGGRCASASGWIPQADSVVLGCSLSGVEHVLT